MIGIKLEKGWRFKKYDGGNNINSMQQIHIFRGNLEIHMLQHDRYDYHVKHSIRKSESYNSYIDKFWIYEEAKVAIMKLMRKLF